FGAGGLGVAGFLLLNVDWVGEHFPGLSKVCAGCVSAMMVMMVVVLFAGRGLKAVDKREFETRKQAAHLQQCVTAASSLIDRFLVRDEPFYLYLRGFTEEANRVPFPGPNSSWSFGGYTRTEPEELRSFLSDKTVLAFANRLDPSPLPEVHHLPATMAGWTLLVRELAARAEGIIVWVDYETRGVVEELEILLDLSLETRTTVFTGVQPRRGARSGRPNPWEASAHVDALLNQFPAVHRMLPAIIRRAEAAFKEPLLRPRP
ncbi:MAG: hypothetical protein KC431_12855, partial [Myxococcales bacterium]|nr:hypothetical protein [Myxococcales bacterium]